MFQEALDRTKEISNIKTHQDLADFIGITRKGVSKHKQRDTFPAEWAMKIGEEFGVCPYWIWTGKSCLARKILIDKKYQEENGKEKP